MEIKDLQKEAEEIINKIDQKNNVDHNNNETTFLHLTEEFGEIAENTGANVEIISTETEEGETLYSTFGGIVAILRYKSNY